MSPHHAIAAMGLAGMYVYTAINGYVGILHDAQVYAFQALAKIKPETLGSDLFLKYGSQDNLSIFSRLYAPLIQLLGLSTAAMAAAVLSNALLFTGTGYLLLQECKWALAWAGLSSVAIWPVTYNIETLMTVAEPFATPRPMACGASLLAIAQGLRNRYFHAFWWWLIALIIHPLMALPVPLVMLFVAISPTRAMLYLSLASIGLLLGAWLGLPILDRVFEPMDPAWRNVTLNRAPYLALSRWPIESWTHALLGVLEPMLISCRLSGSLRRLYVMAGLASGLGLLVSWVGGDMLSNLLVLQIQPWRMTWLGHWLGVAGMGQVFIQSRVRGVAMDRVAWMGLASAELLTPGFASTVVLLLAMLIVRGAHVNGKGLGCGFILRCSEIVLALSFMVNLYRLIRESPDAPLLEIMLTDPALWAGLLMAAYAWRDWMSHRMIKLLLVPAVAGFLLSAPLYYWASASQRERREFAPPLEVNAILQRLPEGGSVLWEPGPRNAWFRLGYPSYISRIQAAGTVFSRETAMEAARRSRLVEAVFGERDYLRWHAHHLRRTSPDSADVLRLCADPRLSAIFFKDSVSEYVHALEIHDSRGTVEGWLVFCQHR